MRSFQVTPLLLEGLLEYHCEVEAAEAEISDDREHLDFAHQGLLGTLLTSLLDEELLENCITAECEYHQE